MANKIAFGSADGPKKIFGAENVNWQGAQRAGGVKVSGSISDAISDFSSGSQSDLETADISTRLKDINLSQYTNDEPYEVWGDSMSGEADQTRIWVEDGQLTMEETWSDNPSSTIISCMGEDYNDVMEKLEEFDEEIPDEVFTIYDEEMSAYLNRTPSKDDPHGTQCDTQPLEKDYQQWSIYTTRDMNNLGDESLSSLYDSFNDAHNTFEYRVPSEVQARISHRVRTETSFGDMIDTITNDDYLDDESFDDE